MLPREEGSWSGFGVATLSQLGDKSALHGYLPTGRADF